MSSELKIWPKLGVGITTYPLPAEVISSLKKAMMEDMPALKYVVIDIASGNKHTGDDGELDGILTTIDNARHYHLTPNEMQEACFRFANSKNKAPAAAKRLVRRTTKKRAQLPPLPQPKIGSMLFRKDKRRGSSCRVLDIVEQQVTVQWVHSGRKTRIKLTNLRNPNLYMTRRPSS